MLQAQGLEMHLHSSSGPAPSRQDGTTVKPLRRCREVMTQTPTAEEAAVRFGPLGLLSQWQLPACEMMTMRMSEEVEAAVVVDVRVIELALHPAGELMATKEMAARPPESEKTRAGPAAAVQTRTRTDQLGDDSSLHHYRRHRDLLSLVLQPLLRTGMRHGSLQLARSQTPKLVCASKDL